MWEAGIYILDANATMVSNPIHRPSTLITDYINNAEVKQQVSVPLPSRLSPKLQHLLWLVQMPPEH